MVPINTDKLVISAKAALSGIILSISFAGAITFGYAVQTTRVDALIKATEDDRRSLERVLDARTRIMDGLDRRLTEMNKTTTDLIIAVNSLRIEVESMNKGQKHPHANNGQ